MEDNINPEYYRRGEIGCWDAIKSAVADKQGTEAACVSLIIKYVWRYRGKNGLEDLKKARWYLEKLIEEVSK